jgi:hypothetical protein
MSRVKVNAIEGVPCASCGLGNVPYGPALAWLAVAGLLGWIFVGTLRIKRPQRAS